MALKVTLFGHHFVSLPFLYIVISGFTCNNNNNNNNNKQSIIYSNNHNNNYEFL